MIHNGIACVVIVYREMHIERCVISHIGLTANDQVDRYIDSGMASVLAATVASWVFHGPMWWPIALLAAGGVWMAIGAGATVLAMCASGQSDHARRLLHPEAHRIEVVTMSIA